MDIKQLKHFLALVEHGTYAKASEAVCLSQPALTRSIQQLESQLGAQLFERGRFGANLTVFGQKALSYVKEILNQEASLRHALVSLSGLTSGELRIGAGPYPSFTLIDDMATTFVQRYPKVSLTIHTDHWSNLHQKLLSCDIELFVADVTELEQNPNLEIVRLRQLAGIVVCQSNHPLCSENAVEWADIFRYPIALPNLPPKMSDSFRSISESLGCAYTRIQCESIPMLLNIVAGSTAITLLPEDFLNKLPTGNGLSKLPVKNIPEAVKTNFGIVRLANRQTSPAAHAFLQLLGQSES